MKYTCSHLWWPDPVITSISIFLSLSICLSCRRFIVGLCLLTLWPLVSLAVWCSCLADFLPVSQALRLCRLVCRDIASQRLCPHRSRLDTGPLEATTFVSTLWVSFPVELEGSVCKFRLIYSLKSLWTLLSCSSSTTEQMRSQLPSLQLFGLNDWQWWYNKGVTVMTWILPLRLRAGCTFSLIVSMQSMTSSCKHALKDQIDFDMYIFIY